MKDKYEVLNIKGENIEIDINCVPMVKYFNEIGLDTKFSCEGHEAGDLFEIIFEDYINDEKMLEFLEAHSEGYNHTPFCGSFIKWYRKSGDCIISNWMYLASDKEYAKIDIRKMRKLNKEMD